MLYLDFLRHGETNLSHTLRGRTDDALTAKGWAQMRSTITQSEQTGQAWDVIYSSPLQRCRLFSEQWAEQKQLPLYIEPNLQEMDFGEWEAQSTERLYQLYPDELAQFWQTPLSFTPPQAESLLTFKSRVLESVETLTQQMYAQGWTRALIISHGGVIKLLKCQALKQHDNDLLKMSAELGQLNCFVFDQGQLQFIQSEDV
ncbi:MULTISPECIES: histidine phosphatase family protein [Acinetobacter]|uniref:Histidine phosphatase family protein n=3 Tax=Acinetobacter johnsonii TaxID=40214 RepID=A0AAJ6ICE3_ACIJO|nr:MULTISPECIES: histidine phosphatase family protein [Acinetobacter]ALV72460.1 fructose-2,6-bisphosphatase [Acinetobacter johnsonii XBB1]MBO7704264.1 histidine phosphatase family protein [Acinetobacter sp.]MCV2450330.1 histidine phosphatase family protein [Acinetobacter johnsonii]MDG9785984.1 histidine phosphatase family protein [Acinetobacter johnsonii]MDH1239501.1 histidine phosphatase family protein [Acinetobacter johnsonii]